MGAHASKSSAAAPQSAHGTPQQSSAWQDAVKSSRPHRNGVHAPFASPALNQVCPVGSSRNVDNACVDGVDGQTSKAFVDGAMCSAKSGSAFAPMLRQNIGNTMSATAIRLARERRPIFSQQ